uniref:WAP four-disulfide core domain protein 5 n=1 Tax=Rattus norvegicus TaxID=10116 RepID=A0A8I6GMM5_RAT
ERRRLTDTKANGDVWTLSKKVGSSTGLGDLVPDKLGGCPPDDGPCSQVIPDQCANDKQCPSSWKCCSRACFLQCMPRVFVKLGKCPVDQLHCLSPRKHLCDKDLDCSGKKRCCVSACGRDCRDPSKG